MTLHELHDYCEKVLKAHPELYDDVTSIYELDDIKDLIQYEDLV